MTARRFLVSGKVQGVGFRYFVLREARALGVWGWARNLDDGRVEVLAAGEPGLVATLEGRLWEGPPYSRVAAVEGSTAEPPTRVGFHVRSAP